MINAIPKKVINEGEDSKKNEEAKGLLNRALIFFKRTMCSAGIKRNDNPSADNAQWKQWSIKQQLIRLRKKCA